jgi:predicted ABC-type ATPase
MPAQRARPVIFVLAGVNGAGKSSVGGAILKEHGLKWFNPDAFSRQRVAQGVGKDAADAEAWAYGKSRLEAAIAGGTDFALKTTLGETTLGGNTITALLARAAATHDVVMIFCGLESVESHIARVALRVRHGGHDIPEQRIRERWTRARGNLISLLPHLKALQAFDNSLEAAPGKTIPPPRLVLETAAGRVLHPAPGDLAALKATPGWAKPIVEAALAAHGAQGEET